MRKIIIEIEVDSEESLSAIEEDLKQEILCCWNWFDVDNMKVKEEVMSAKERVEKEAAELREKIDKLGNFLPTEAFEALSELQKDLLYQQYDIMCAYYKVLCTRIKNW